MQVVRELGYRANRHARGLRSGRSGTLALLLPVRASVPADEALSLEFYMRLASAAASAAFSQDEALMLLPPAIVQTGLRGIELDLGRPDDPWYVASETDANTRQVLDHLAAQGARRIALLVPRTDWGWATETLTAYDGWVRQVPGELLIAAGVDSIQAREGDPPVTALDLHPELQAEAAVGMLLNRLDGAGADAPRYIRATLSLRASTGASPSPGRPRPARETRHC